MNIIMDVTYLIFLCEKCDIAYYVINWCLQKKIVL